MTELTVRRVVIACDAACDIRLAVQDAAALAGRCSAALHGIFLEDENLYRLAALPFGRQTTLSPTASASLDPAELERLSSALGALMRQLLATAAAEHGLDWSFGVVRDLPHGGALAGAQGDLLVVQGSARPFAGSWAPRSLWQRLPENYPGTILVRRQRTTGPGTVVVISGNPAGQQRLMQSGFAIAAPGGRIVVIVRNRSPAALEATTKAIRALAAPQAHGTKKAQKVNIEAAAGDTPRLLRQIERLKPSTIVVDAADVDTASLHDLLATTSCDVLLLR